MLTTLNKLHFLALTAALVLTGCAQLSPKECMVRDWYEQGRIDGSQGLSSARLEEHLNSCPDVASHPETSDVYKNGWNAGLTQYCSPSNGFELGAAGKSYEKVCPVILERVFLAEYEKGQKLLELENQNAEIESELAQLTSQRSPAADDPPEVRSQIRRLISKRDANIREMSKIRSSLKLSL